MGDLLYGRRCRLVISVPVKTPGDYRHVTTNRIEVNGEEADRSGLRVRFKIAKTSEKEPNTCEVTVTNLSESTRSALQVKGVKVSLEAGYEQVGMSRIYVGDARTVDHIKDGGDWNTVMKLGDGERSIRFARFSESFAPGTGAGDVLRALANATGLELGNLPDEAANIQRTFDQGYSVSGPVSRSIDRLVRSIGYVWSVQDGALQVRLPGSTLGSAIPEISPETGLVESPEMGSPEKKGKPALVKFKSLLLAVTPGAKVRLKSARYDGDVRVKKCQYDGDTHGGDWYTTIEGVVAQ